MQDVSAEGAPEPVSLPDGESLPSVWEDDTTTDRQTDPDAVTAPGRRLRPPPRRSSLGPQGLRPARPRRPRSDVMALRPEEPTCTRTCTVALSSSSASGHDEETGSFSVQLPSGFGAAELGELGGDRRCDVRHLGARRLDALGASARRQLFVRLAGQQAIVGSELVLEDDGRHARREATSCALVLLANRHVSRHRSRGLVAEMFAAAPEALLERVAMDRRLSRAVVDHLPLIASAMSSSSHSLLQQAVAAWLRQRSVTATQAVARLLRQAPTWDRHATSGDGAASPADVATIAVASLEVLIAQQTFAAGEVAIAVARLVDGPGVGTSFADAVASALCARATAGFALR